MSFACPETGERVTLVRVAQTGLSALTLVVGLHAGRLISVLLEIVLVYLADQVCGQVGLLFVCVVKKCLVIGAQLALVALDHVIGHPVVEHLVHGRERELAVVEHTLVLVQIVPEREQTVVFEVKTEQLDIIFVHGIVEQETTLGTRQTLPIHGSALAKFKIDINQT